MTGRDGDAEPLRVPPWLTGGEPAADPPPPDEPIHDQEPHFVPLAPPELVNARLAPPPADPPEPDPRRRWILAGVAVVLLLLPTLLIVSLLDKGKITSPPLGVLPTFSDVSLPVPPVVAPTSAAPSPVAPSVSPSSTRAAPPPPAPTATKAVRFGPVTIEAEAPGNVLGGSAWVDQYPGASGGAVVRNLGNWNDRKGAGFLRFAGITVPADGEYTLRFFFVNIDNERTRTVVITASTGPAQTLSVQGGATCCTSASVRLPLRKGTNTITFSNGQGHAPSIDRIVLSLP